MKLSLFFSICLLFCLSLPAQEAGCSRRTQYGKVDLCFPVLDGYRECYFDKHVKPIADATEAQQNQVLGYYLDSSSYANRESIGQGGLQNFFKIYGTRSIEHLEVDEPMFAEFYSSMGAQFLKKGWEDVAAEIKDQIGLAIAQPTTLKDYKLSDNSFTYILLMNYQQEETEDQLVAIAMNGMFLHNRALWMAYYLKFEGPETIEALESTNNRILSQFMQAQE